MAKLQEARQDLQASLAAAQDTLAAADQAAQAHGQQQAALEGQLDSLQFQLQASSAAEAGLTAKLKAQQARVAALEAAGQRAGEAAAAAAKEQSELLQAEHKGLVSVQAGHEQALARVQGELQGAQQAAAGARAELAESAASVASLQQVGSATGGRWTADDCLWHGSSMVLRDQASLKIPVGSLLSDLLSSNTSLDSQQGGLIGTAMSCKAWEVTCPPG